VYPLWLIPVLPLVGFIVNGLLSLGSAGSKRGPSRGFVAALAVAMPLLAFLVTIGATAHIWNGPTTLPIQTYWEWLPIGKGLGFGLQFDRLTALMLLFITGIGTLIHLYSVGYMREDRGFARFMAYLNLFMASMIILVLGDSLPVTFLGWEGVGLCSYLLIGFWHQDHANNDAARKAFVINRIGDLGFLLGAFCLYLAMGKDASLRYVDIADFFQGDAGKALASTPLIVAACALLFLGCTGKSAQLPLLTWLPDAMAGPTPVSALIHAATMVTSGVYLAARLSDVFVLAPAVMTAITLIGCATAVYGAIAGLVQWDIKKVLAYSTVSQLGFMFMAVGVGAFDVALYHVFTHAFFKATLFLGAGSVIHALHHEQDLRRMGGLTKVLPLTYSSMVFGWFAIIGMPLGSGFMSKDLILERLWAAPDMFGVQVGKLVCVVALITALLTAIYMSRLMYYVFWSPSRVPAEVKAHAHEAPFVMSAPVLLLSFGSMVAGAMWFGAVPQINAFELWLRPVVEHAQGATALVASADPHAAAAEPHDHSALAWAIAGCSIAVAFFGWLIAHLLFRRGPKESEPRPLSGFAAAWTSGLDRIYDLVIAKPLAALAWIVARVIDQALLTGVLRGIGEVSGFLGEGYVALQRSRLRISVTLSLLGAVVVVAYLLMPVLSKAA